mmetsp:Transcript_4964/g.17262  ORF Transcript_4964/g.17262 Transcript_4964/m.17262 type:complete len:244 (+) Transcript_4964:313-1044(+)
MQVRSAMRRSRPSYRKKFSRNTCAGRISSRSIERCKTFSRSSSESWSRRQKRLATSTRANLAGAAKSTRRRSAKTFSWRASSKKTSQTRGSAGGAVSDLSITWRALTCARTKATAASTTHARVANGLRHGSTIGRGGTVSSPTRRRKRFHPRKERERRRRTLSNTWARYSCASFSPGKAPKRRVFSRRCQPPQLSQIMLAIRRCMQCWMVASTTTKSKNRCSNRCSTRVLTRTSAMVAGRHRS